MGTTADKLNKLLETKQSIKTAIVNKGVDISDTETFASYAEKIQQIRSGSEPKDGWKPNPNWWDIEKILDEDTRNYPSKVGVILYNFNDVSDFTLSSTGMTAVATSDGSFYSWANNGTNVTHNWDTTQDKDDGRGFKTRWVIYYYIAYITSDVFRLTDTKFGWQYNYIAYLVLRINCSKGANFCTDQRLLEGVNNVGFAISGTSFSSAFYNCYSLQKPPEGLDASRCTTFTSFMSNCYSLQKLPDVLNTSKGTGFNSFLYGCYSLQKLPNVLDTSRGTSFSSFLYNCYSLQKLPDVLDTSKGTAFTSFMLNCASLQKFPEIRMSANTGNISSKYTAPFNGSAWVVEIPLTLPSNTNFFLDMSTRISIESFRYIADHAPNVTASPKTLIIGATNITRCNQADPTIISDLTAKGWTVS